jgi:hypothetical protein
MVYRSGNPPGRGKRSTWRTAAKPPSMCSMTSVASAASKVSPQVDTRGRIADRQAAVRRIRHPCRWQHVFAAQKPPRQTGSTAPPGMGTDWLRQAHRNPSVHVAIRVAARGDLDGHWTSGQHVREPPGLLHGCPAIGWILGAFCYNFGRVIYDGA